MLRSPELTPLQVVVLVLENHQDEVLLSHRAAGKHLAGYWEFPGGKIETNESPDCALRREIMEELRFDPEGAKKILEIDYPYPERPVRLLIHHLKIKHPQVYSNEGQPLQWIPKAQLPKVQLPPANQAIIRHLLQD